MPYQYLKPKSEKDDFFILHKQKTASISTDGPPFPIWFILSLYFYFLKLCNGLSYPLQRLCPDWRQDMSPYHCLNNKSHYLPFLTLRHGVANFFPSRFQKSILHKSGFATSCRKLFSYILLKIYPTWIPLCDIVSQSPDLTCSKKNGLFPHSPYCSPPAGSAVPSVFSSLPSISYKSNSSFILIFNWCFI